MTVTPRHSGLLRLLANLDQQISEAHSLLAEFDVESDEAKAIHFWLDELSQSVAETETKLNYQLGIKRSCGHTSDRN